MNLCIIHTALVSATVLTILLLLTQYFHFSDSHRYRLLFVSYVIFAANELVFLWLGNQFSYFHMLIDCIVISVAILGLASVEMKLSSISGQFLFHYALFLSRSSQRPFWRLSTRQNPSGLAWCSSDWSRFS